MEKKYWWKLPSYRFNALFVLFLLVGYNSVFFKLFYETSPNVLFSVMGTLCIFLLFNAAATILMFRYTSKFWAIVLCLLSTLVFYFMKSYNVVMDKIMLLNALETDANEISELFNISILFYLIFGFAVPAILIIKTKIIFLGWQKEVLKRLAIVLVSLIAVGGIVFAGYKNTAQFMRNNKQVRYRLIPSNYIGAVISVVKIKRKAAHKELVKIGEDARLERYWTNKNKKNLVVLVVGETARAANFSLNGYERNTNEALAPYRKEIINFENVSSCGTSTAISLPCMFSRYGRRHFNAGESDYTENLLDIAGRAGYQVLWRENNSGCKGVCKRVETEKACATGACFDEVLLKDFKNKITSYNKDMLVVLHQMGSHGPTYYRRYPKEDEKFKPICNTERLDTCSREEIINVYDNSIYYSSKNLAGIIGELKKLSKDYNVVLVYMSDHGESLGENNIYLHAAPYMIAPDEQTQIPFLIWFDEGTAKNMKFNRKCLMEKQKSELSHDNLFHSLLGLLGIETREYDPKLDIWSDCRN